MEGEGEEGGNKAVKAEENDLDWRRICFRGLKLAPSERFDTGDANGSSSSSSSSSTGLTMVVGMLSESTLRRDERPPKRDKRDMARLGRAFR